jgi:hypothetical protein
MPEAHKITTTLHPEELPEHYAMDCEGTCLEPMVMDGTKLLFSRDERYMPGDLVALYFRPEIVKPGEHQVLVKKLVLGVPHRFWKDPSCNAGSNIKPVVIVEMLNPRKMIYINPDALLGIHKCLGPVPADMTTYKVTEDEVRAMRPRIAASASMPVTRRGALAFVARGAAVATTAAVAAPATAGAVERQPEVHPLARLRALHEEASELMAVYNEYMGDEWELRIRAPHARVPVIYKNLSAERELPPLEKAKWHMRELGRLISEDGGAFPMVIAVADYGDDSGYHGARGISLRGDDLTNTDGMFVPKGGVA